MGALNELVEKLPPELQWEVEDFARFLLETRKQTKGARLRLDWAGALSETRDSHPISVFFSVILALCQSFRLTNQLAGRTTSEFGAASRWSGFCNADSSRC